MRICLPLPHAKDVIFDDLRKHGFCFDLPQVVRRFPGPDPGPLGHLESLATILQLTASLPKRLPLREELHGLASRALDAAVADLGEGVELHRENVSTHTAQAT